MQSTDRVVWLIHVMEFKINHIVWIRYQGKLHPDLIIYFFEMSKQSRLDDLQTIKASLQSLNELCNRMITNEEKLHRSPSVKKVLEREIHTKIISNLRNNLFKKKKTA